MIRKKSFEETYAETSKVFIIPAKAKDPTHFIKILYNNFSDLKHVPNSVVNDFIILACRCAEFTEFDTNVIRMKSSVLAKNLGMTPQTLSTKLTTLEKYNLIKRFKDPETGCFSIIINTNYSYKCSDYKYITLQKQIFEKNGLDIDLIKEILDKIKTIKNYSNFKKKEYADREGKREIDHLEKRRKLELTEKEKEIEYYNNRIAELEEEKGKLMN
ncbi:hypothetical protein [Niallia sp. RD1]|uniref:hypothetical protein n=1 Tax=Niallia sp. RD1 TaxID=2962858 RepID=UPI0020C1AB61|nr:hypothetical protein [Niallia sp. RD1]UTI42854.1 hypothetical protein NKG37_03680 [Niallia sp. RD1]